MNVAVQTAMRVHHLRSSASTIGLLLAHGARVAHAKQQQFENANVPDTRPLPDCYALSFAGLSLGLSLGNLAVPFPRRGERAFEVARRRSGQTPKWLDAEVARPLTNCALRCFPGHEG